MIPPPSSNTYSALFAGHFGQLVILLRRQPGQVAAQKSALRSAMAVLARGPVWLETGIEYSDVPDDNSLKGRLLSRHVDSISFAAGATAKEILALARALAQDHGLIPSTGTIAVELLPASSVRADLESGDLPAVTQRDHQPPPAQRHRTMSGPVEETEKLTRALERSAAGGRWMEAIHAAQALVRLTPRFPEHEQRAHLIGLRRTFTRRLLDQFIAFAMRATEEQARVGEILRYAGPDGIELMLDQVRSGEIVGPRKFIHDVLANTPAAFPMLLPLLTSPKWHEVRHGAELLGRLGLPEAIDPLRDTAHHPDERVRQAVVEALGRFSEHSVIEPIRRALADPAPRTRVSAAYVLSQRNSPGLALPILVALSAEKDPEAWDDLVAALARIDSTEAVSALVGIAVDKHPLFQAARPRSQRLAVVRALLQARTNSSRRGLERLANEGDSQVRRAAAAALEELTGSQ